MAGGPTCQCGDREAFNILRTVLYMYLRALHRTVPSTHTTVKANERR